MFYPIFFVKDFMAACTQLFPLQKQDPGSIKEIEFKKLVIGMSLFNSLKITITTNIY